MGKLGEGGLFYIDDISYVERPDIMAGRYHAIEERAQEETAIVRLFAFVADRMVDCC